MSQFWENLRTDRRTDGRIDTLFYTTLLAEAGVQKMNFHLSAQKIRWKSCTKYLGHFKDHISTSKQTNRVNRILDKLRHCLPSDILKNSNLFLTHVYYACQVWRPRQQWHTSHGSKSSKQHPKNSKFQGRKTPMWSSGKEALDTKPY